MRVSRIVSRQRLDRAGARFRAESRTRLDLVRRGSECLIVGRFGAGRPTGALEEETRRSEEGREKEGGER